MHVRGDEPGRGARKMGSKGGSVVLSFEVYFVVLYCEYNRIVTYAST